MGNLLKTAGNALFVIGGFLVVFFGVNSKLSGQNDRPRFPLATDPANIAHADAPENYAQTTYYGQTTYYTQTSYYNQSGYYGQSSYGDSYSGGDDGDGGDSGCK